jgi:hypothetical protein
MLMGLWQNQKKGTLIRHADLFLPVSSLAVSMIKLPFRALLMAFVGSPPLGAPGLIAAWLATIAMSAIAVRANKEHGVALLAETNSVQENRVTVSSALGKNDPVALD